MHGKVHGKLHGTVHGTVHDTMVQHTVRGTTVYVIAVHETAVAHNDRTKQ